MKTKLFSAMLVLGLLVGCQPGKKASPPVEDTSSTWTNLLDKDLSQWRTYLSYELKNGYNGSIPKDAAGNELAPIGYDKNEKDVFSVIEESDGPVLRISGEIYGCIFTKQDFRNYRLRMKMKWGTLKWEPRTDKALDSGLLYHSQGECGVDYFHSWMLSHEFQVCEQVNGEYWTIGNAQIDVRARKENDAWIFDEKAEQVTLGAETGLGGHCMASSDPENPTGEWNDLELICYEGKSIHLVNGEVVMAISDLRYWNGEMILPLDEGKIQLQSEAGEVFYKDIEIQEINEIPEDYQYLFK